MINTARAREIQQAAMAEQDAYVRAVSQEQLAEDSPVVLST